MIVETPTVDPDHFEQRTGWASKPEGLCKGSMCVPAPEAIAADGTLDVATLAARLDMPLVRDEATGVAALGPESPGHSLTTAVAPELTLPDQHGNPFSLSSLHGRKVLLVAWASW